MVNRTPNLRAQTYALLVDRDGEQCKWCDETGVKLEVDHELPLHLDGTDDLSNLQLLCVPCHREKSRCEVSTFAYFKRRYAA